MTPRRWQTECREVMVAHLTSDAGRREPAVFAAATGTGKTSTAMLILRRLRQLHRLPDRTVIATSRTDLVADLQRACFAGLDPRAQAIGAAAIHAGGEDVLEAIGESEIVGRYDGRQKRLRPVTVTTYPSLPRCLAEMGGAGLLVCDEAHRSAAPEALDAVRSVDLRFGMSGTLYLGDASRTIAAFTRTLYRYTAADAVRDGVIVPWEIRSGAMAAPVEGGGIERDRALAALLGEIAADGGIEAIGPGLIAADKIAEARWIADALTEQGIAARAVSGEDSRSARRDAVLSVRDGRTQAIVTVDLWGEGVDCPELRWLALLDVRKRVQLVQLVGRVVRSLHPERHATAIERYGAKERAIIYDPCQVMAAQGLDADDALGEKAPPEKPLSKAERERAEIDAIVSDPTPYAVGVSPLERWSLGLYDAVYAVVGRLPGLKLRARPEPGVRGLPAADSQWAAMGRLMAALRWLTGEEGERHRAMVRAVLEARTASYGVAADLIDVLLMVRAWADRHVMRQGDRFCRVAFRVSVENVSGGIDGG